MHSDSKVPLLAFVSPVSPALPATTHDWLTPNWPAPSNVQAVFTTRQGGTSNSPYDTMNLGEHVGDTPAHVATNRAALSRVTGVRSVFLRQTHSTDAVALHPGMADGCHGDASVTNQRRLACTVMVADCLPVLLCSADGAVVAAAHAGWRGLAGGLGDSDNGEQTGILESVHALMCRTAEASFLPLRQRLHSSSAIKIIAWLGPCIGSCAFEVGQDVKDAFVRAQPQAAGCFVATRANKYLADLPTLARLRLQRLGITQVYGNDSSAPWCTASNASRFFSHRRDAGAAGNGLATTGRMAAVVWRV